MCIAKPTWAKPYLKDDEEDNGPSGRELQGKPASEHPDWKWVVMDECWTIVHEWHRRMDYCNPDNFNMYIYNDWYGWGLTELQENLVGLSEWIACAFLIRVTARSL